MPDNRARHTFLKVDTDSDTTNNPANASSVQAASNVWFEAGNVQAARGNELVGYTLPEGVCRVVGCCEDNEGGLVYFLYNSEGRHQLVRFRNGACSLLLEHAALRLDPAEPVLGAVVLDGVLVYRDAAGELRAVSVARAQAGVYTAEFLSDNPYALHLVKPAPNFAPDFSRGGTSGNTPTQVAEHHYQFAFAYGYPDGERTLLGPYSPISYRAAGELINVYPPFEGRIPSGVTELLCYVRVDDENEWQLLGTKLRQLTDAPFSNSDALFHFYGATTGEVLPATEAAKTFESLWPCQAMTVARSRVFAADFREGYDTPTTTLTAQAVPITTSVRGFKHNSSVSVGIQFYDALLRPYGVALPIDNEVAIPAPTYPAYPAQPPIYGIEWNLPTTDPAELQKEIPAEAAYYALVATTNRRATYFWQTVTTDIRRLRHYYQGDGSGKWASGDPVLGDVSEPGGKLWLDIGSMALTGQQTYVFAPGSGDRVRILADGIDAPITQQRGNFLEIETAATPASGRTRIEIYSPRSLSGDMAYYEQSKLYPVQRTEAGRDYSTRSGELVGDVFLNPITLYHHDQAPSGGSKAPEEETRYYRSHLGPDINDAAAPVAYEFIETPGQALGEAVWLDAARGRIAVYLRAGSKQILRASLLRYSGVKVQGTRLNGLGIWDATAQDDLPQEQGAIVRLVVADQTQADGSLLLAVQERGAESRYLGQSVVTQGDGATTLALTKGVLGGGNALRGGYGCTPRHAASVVAYAGRVFWYCDERQEVVRYAQNGVTPLGLTYRFRARLSAVARQYGSLPAVGGYDPRRDEYWLTFPGFFVLRGQTLAWNERRESWVDSYEAQPECLGHAGNQFVSFQNGQLWQHGPNAPFATFFGQRSPASLTFTASVGAGQSKLWKQVEVESETGWLPTRLTIERGADTPMQSRMSPEWLRYLEGVWRGAFRRDENSPGGLLSGRPLIGDALRVTLTAPVLPTPLTAVSIGFQLRPGRT